MVDQTGTLLPIALLVVGFAVQLVPLLLHFGGRSGAETEPGLLHLVQSSLHGFLGTGQGILGILISYLIELAGAVLCPCLLYTSPSPRD